MAKAVGISLRSVQRIWEAHKLQPHRVRTFKRSRDPEFAAKLTDIVGLYMDPPAHAVVLSIDEKSQIQALDRTQPGLPIKPGRCGTMTHDYKRHGTTTLFAALNVLDGTVIGRCMQQHRHEEFIRFLNDVERAVPAGKLIEAVVDNYATHKHPKVKAWLARHPRWTFHFTPTSGSWLNAVENFFSVLTRKRIRRGSFHSHRRPASRHQALPRRAQRRAEALRLDRIRRLDPRQTRQTACIVRMSQSTSCSPAAPSSVSKSAGACVEQPQPISPGRRADMHRSHPHAEAEVLGVAQTALDLPSLAVEVDQRLGGFIGGAGGQAPRLFHVLRLHADHGGDLIALGCHRGAAQHPRATAGADPVGGGARLAVGGGDRDVAAKADDEVELQLLGQHPVELLVAEAAIGHDAHRTSAGRISARRTSTWYS